MKQFISTAIILVILVFLGCNPPAPKGDSASLPPKDTIFDSERDDVSAVETDIIKYTGAADDETKKKLETFSPFTTVTQLAAQSIHIKDSLEIIRGTEPLTTHEDSAVFMPYVNAAYQAILAYRELMMTGSALKDKCPSLLQLNRTIAANDSIFSLLPKAGESKFLSHGKFFFVGGAPFIGIIHDAEENSTVFTDPNGNPEARYQTSITENANYLLNYIYSFNNIPTTVTFGPPLDSYDTGPQEVKGIGSLIHSFTSRIPAFLLTEDGLIPASIVSVSLKLVPQNLGCNSDQPLITFACAKDIEENKILGIYIPFNSANINSCSITRQSADVWTADINADGIADLASVSSSFIGIVGDAMADVLWFANINGTWKIIDWGRELDCT